MRRLLVLLAGIVAVLSFIVPSAVASSNSAVPRTHSVNAPVPSSRNDLRRASQYEWADLHFNGFMRDPNSGGINTHVLASNQNTSNAEDWFFFVADPGCGTTVSSTCPGGFISTQTGFYGDSFVTLQNVAAPGSLCYAANAQNSWLGFMGTCDGVGGNHHFDTIFVYDPDAACPGGGAAPFFFSYQWNANGNNTDGDITDDSGIGFDIPVVKDPNVPICKEALWNPTGS